MSFKYTLIVSQYYNSRHMFIVGHAEDFIERAKAFIEELEDYKRDNNELEREYNYGDIGYYPKGHEIKSRYNVKDSGDIYFINSNYANYCMDEAKNYQKQTDYESKQPTYRKSSVISNISAHHYYNRVKEIVENHFEIV